MRMSPGSSRPDARGVPVRPVRGTDRLRGVARAFEHGGAFLRFPEKRLHVPRAFAAAGADAQLVAELAHRTRAVLDARADLAVGHGVADANVHAGTISKPSAIVN